MKHAIDSRSRRTAVDRLRDERPEHVQCAGFDRAAQLDRRRVPGVVPSTPVASRRRSTHGARWVRVSVIAAILAAVALFTGVTLRDGTHRSVRPNAGITVAAAREIAVNALEQLDALEDYDYSTSTRTTELAGRRRVSSYTQRIVIIGNDYIRTRSQRNDFAGIAKNDPEVRLVHGQIYQASASPRLKQPWLISANGIPGSSYGPRSDPFSHPPDFAQLVTQLERERLASARRTRSGRIVVELERPARDLAPVGGAAVRSVDPIATFAMSVAWQHPKDVITVRIDISPDGQLRRIRAGVESEAVVGDNHGGLHVVARTEQEWRLRPVAGRTIDAPNPKQVVVVGDVIQTRRGATGLLGPHGTLDTFTDAELAHLRSRVRRAPRRLMYPPLNPGGPMRKVNPDWERRMEAGIKRFRRQSASLDRIMRTYRPVDRSRLATDPACIPYWPATGRRMDLEVGRSHPERAGWTCTFSGVGSFSITPGRGELQSQPGDTRGLSMSFGR